MLHDLYVALVLKIEFLPYHYDDNATNMMLRRVFILNEIEKEIVASYKLYVPL